MIRARKEDHHQRESEQRRPLVLLPTSNKLPVSGSNTHAGVLIPSSVGATGGCSTNTVAAATTTITTSTTNNNNNNNSSSVNMNSPSPNPRGVTSNNKPASAAAWTTNQLKNATAASSSTVKQLYHELKQHNARRKYRKTSFYGSRSKKGDEHHPTPHHDWTAQVPKRMWFTTLGIFLVLPVLIFLWKEIMLKPPLGDGQQQLRHGAAAVGAGHALIQPKNRYVTWMNEEKDVTGAPPLEEEFGYNNETNAALSRNETDRVDGEWKDNTIIAEKSRDTETGDKSLADLLKEKKLLDQMILQKVAETPLESGAVPKVIDTAAATTTIEKTVEMESSDEDGVNAALAAMHAVFTANGGNPQRNVDGFPHDGDNNSMLQHASKKGFTNPTLVRNDDTAHDHLPGSEPSSDDTVQADAVTAENPKV